MGTLLSAFFWTYALFQIPAGYLTDRFGPEDARTQPAFWCGRWLRRPSGWRSPSVRCWLPAAFGNRRGCGHSGRHDYIRRNFRPEEQGLPTGLFASGAMLGPALGAFLGAIMLDRVGWRWVFILTGMGGCLWLLPWAALVSPRRPSQRRHCLSNAHAAAMALALQTARNLGHYSWRLLLPVWFLLLSYLASGIPGHGPRVFVF